MAKKSHKISFESKVKTVVLLRIIGTFWLVVCILGTILILYKGFSTTNLIAPSEYAELYKEAIPSFGRIIQNTKLSAILSGVLCILHGITVFIVCMKLADNTEYGYQCFLQQQKLNKTQVIDAEEENMK